MRWRQLAAGAVDRVWAGHVLQTEIGCNRVVLDGCVKARQSCQRVQFGSESKVARGVNVVERLLSKDIACQKQFSSTCVVEAERKHRVESGQGVFAELRQQP